MVLITGATGLVGSHLALHLVEHGERVRAIYRDQSHTKFTKKIFAYYQKPHLFDVIEWHQAPLTDIPALDEAFRDITEVYHCAAFISFDRDADEQLRKTNIEGTANIVNLSIAHKIRKLCHVSSIAALGDLKPGEKLIDEETEWNPEKHHSDYSISKFGAEMEVWRGLQEGLQAVIVNPGVILGPVPECNGEIRGSGSIFSAVADDLIFYTKGSTGFVAVTDVVAIMFRLMKSDISGERFAVIENNYKYREIVNTIADAMKVRRPRILATPWMTSLSWKIDWLLNKLTGKKRLMYRDLAASLHSTDKFSNKKIVKTLDYHFTPIPEYIARIAGFYKSA